MKRRIRDYRNEYDRYYGAKGKPHTWSYIQRKRRKHKTMRNGARTKLKKIYGKKKLKNKDVHHKNGNALDNSRSNLGITSIKYNRSRNKRKVVPY